MPHKILKRKYNLNRRKRMLQILQQLQKLQKQKLGNVTYYTNNTNSANLDTVVSWQGICRYDTNNNIMICGTSTPSTPTGQGVLYIGPINGKDYLYLNKNINFISANNTIATSTSIYGPRYKSNRLQMVGSYVMNNNGTNYGFYYDNNNFSINSEDNFSNRFSYTTLYYQTSDTANYTNIATFAHSVDHNLIVGNTILYPNISTSSKNGFIPYAWIYNIVTQTYTKISHYNHFISVYGIVHNSNNSYTIIGGDKTAQSGFICDVDVVNNNNITFSNWTSMPLKQYGLTHFEGISKTNNPNVYTIAGDKLTNDKSNVGFACIAVRSSKQKKFIFKNVININVPGSKITSSNSVLENNVVGIYSASGEDGYSIYQSSVIFV